jgi:hypothetical protein
VRLNFALEASAKQNLRVHDAMVYVTNQRRRFLVPMLDGVHPQRRKITQKQINIARITYHGNIVLDAHRDKQPLHSSFQRFQAYLRSCHCAAKAQKASNPVYLFVAILRAPITVAKA